MSELPSAPSSPAPHTEARYPYVHVDVSRADSDDVSAELWELGASGIEERDAETLLRPHDGATEVTLVASFADEAQAQRAAQRLSAHYPARVEFVVGDDWRDGWRAYFVPTRVGARLLIRPSWEEVRTWPGEVVITVDPGYAFGSGAHQTTRLVLREVDRYVRGGERILDVGCGSGILSIAALKLGAARVRAIDVDRDALGATRENAQLNRVAGRLGVSGTPVDRLRGTYDLVLANIEATVLIEQASAISARVACGGRLVLSGLLVGQQDRVREAYSDLRVRFLTREGEWVALVLDRPHRTSE